MASNAILALSTIIGAHSGSYSFKHAYAGAEFYGDFNFFLGPDPNHGHVQFEGLGAANGSGLVSFLNSAGVSNNHLGGSIFGDSMPIMLNVDSHTVLDDPTLGRSSVRIESVATYKHALIVADIYHMPEGCGTWPGFWLAGGSAPWPEAGDINIIAGVNDMNFNRYVLHTDSGVILDSNNTASQMKGKIVTPSCDINAPDQEPHVGCSIYDTPDSLSFGSGFNKNGGGVFATQFTSDFIKIWFFPRNRIPTDVFAGKPQPPSNSNNDPTGWALPNAFFKAAPHTSNTVIPMNENDANNSTILDKHFDDLRFIFSNTFCGDWGGKVWNDSTSGCSKLAPTCEQFVSAHPAAFQQAYWLINGVSIYEETAQHS